MMISSRVVAFVCVIASVWFPYCVNGQRLEQASPEQPLYELSNIRIERGILANVIAFDYKRTRGGIVGGVELFAHSDNGPLSLHGVSSITDAEGTLRIEDSFRSITGSFFSGPGIEFYLGKTTNSSLLTGEETRVLLSNVIGLGTIRNPIKIPGTPANPQPGNGGYGSNAAMAASAPSPPPVPTGYVICTSEVRLVPGVPVLSTNGSEWTPAKVAVVEGSYVKLLFSGSKKLKTSIADVGMLAISVDILGQLKANPSQFSIDAKTLPGGDLLLDAGMEPVSNPKDLCEGAPVLIQSGESWVERYFLSADNYSARIVDPFKGMASVEVVPLDSLAIRKQTLLDLQKPTAKSDFAKNTKNIKAIALDVSDAPTETLVEAPRVRTSSAAAPSMSAGSLQAPLDGIGAQASMRTWQDRSGKFKIAAQYVDQSDVAVTLRKKDGSSIDVPISKLCDADQQFLKDQLRAIKKPQDSPNETPFLDGMTMADVDYGSPMQIIRQVIKLEGEAKSLAISPDDRCLLVGMFIHGAMLIEIQTGKVLIKSGRMPHVGDVTACGFSPDGQYMLICGSTGAVEVYQRSTEVKSKHGWALSRQFFGHTDGVKCLAFSSDSRFAITGGEDKKAFYWSLETGKSIATLGEFESHVHSVCIRPSDNFLMATDGGTLLVYDPASGTEVQNLAVAEQAYSFYPAVFSSDAKMLATHDSLDLRIWDLDSFSELPRTKVTDSHTALRFAQDNKHLFCASREAINVWDARSQTRLFAQQVPGGWIQVIATNNNGTMIATNSGHTGVAVLRLGTK